MASKATIARQRRRDNAERRAKLSEDHKWWYGLDPQYLHALQSTPHPKFSGFVDGDEDFPHSLFTYCCWLVRKGHRRKVELLLGDLG